jgi:hypothetical protein
MAYFRLSLSKARIFPSALARRATATFSLGQAGTAQRVGERAAALFLAAHGGRLA